MPFDQTAHLDLNNYDNTNASIILETLFDIFTYPYFSTSTIVVSKQLCNSIGYFREDLKTAEDIDFCLKAAELTTTIKINQTISITRRVDNSLGASEQSYPDNLLVIDDFIQRNNSFSAKYPALITTMQKRIYDEWICNLLYERKISQAKAVAIKSLRLKVSFNTSKLLLKAFILSLINK
jgi:hypothetical protein